MYCFVEYSSKIIHYDNHYDKDKVVSALKEKSKDSVWGLQENYNSNNYTYKRPVKVNMAAEI